MASLVDVVVRTFSADAYACGSGSFSAAIDTGELDEIVETQLRRSSELDAYATGFQLFDAFLNLPMHG